MTTSALAHQTPSGGDRTFDHKIHPAGAIGFLAVLLGGIVYAGTSISIDTSHVGEPLAFGAFLFLDWRC